MIPEIGNFALMLATAVALVLGTLPIVGAARGNLRWMALARPAARVIFLLVVVAASCLVASFLHDDFSVVYVATNSTHALPVPYKLAAFCGGHEGSMLLWLLILSFWMFAVSVFSTHLPREMIARILGVMGLIALGFLLFIILTSDPFVRMAAVPDGNDLNPLLQDPGMVAHPPMLYMGYVGFSVAFALPSPPCWAAISMPPGPAGRGPGPPWPGPSSPSASAWAAPGPTTRWAGAAGGSGTPSRTPRSCPGWRAPR